MKKTVLFLIAATLLYACKPAFKPLPPRELEKLLGDINFAETYCSQIKDTAHREVGKNIDSLSYYYQVIMKHYNLTQEQLMANIEWCKANPEELDSVYGKVIIRTVTLQNHMGK